MPFQDGTASAIRQFSKQIYQFLPKITIQNLFSVFGNPNNVMLALPECMI